MRGPLVGIIDPLERSFGSHRGTISDSGGYLADIGGPLVDARVPLAEVETGDTLHNTVDHLADKRCPFYDAGGPLANIGAHRADTEVKRTPGRYKKPND